MNLTNVIFNRPSSPNAMYDGYIENAPVMVKLNDGSEAISGRCWRNDELRALDEAYSQRNLGAYIARRLDSRFHDGGDITEFCEEFKSLYTRWFFQPEGSPTDDENIYIIFGESLV